MDLAPERDVVPDRDLRARRQQLPGEANCLKASIERDKVKHHPGLNRLLRKSDDQLHALLWIDAGALMRVLRQHDPGVLRVGPEGQIGAKTGFVEGRFRLR